MGGGRGGRSAMFRMERVIIGYVGGRGGGEEVFVSRSQYGHKWQLVEISTTCFVGEKKKNRRRCSYNLSSIKRAN